MVTTTGFVFLQPVGTEGSARDSGGGRLPTGTSRLSAAKATRAARYLPCTDSQAEARLPSVHFL